MTHPPKTSRFSLEQLVCLSLGVLPYLSYGALVGLGLALLVSLWRWSREVWFLLYSQGWVGLTLLLGFSVAVSENPLESALESLNFWPFFVFYAALVVAIGQLPQPWLILRRWAYGLVLTSLPVSLRAVLEFYLKAPTNLARWSGNPWLNWLYLEPNYGHRADSVFGHPNVLASYLVIILGLGLSLSADRLDRSSNRWSYAIYGATSLALVGIFCSGSRNGLLVAGLQLGLFFILVRSVRSLLWAGLALFTAMVLAILVWGVGGRSLLTALSTASLRLDAWRLALGMIPQHPWLGSGLGTFKQLYNPADFPAPDDLLPHAHNLWLTLAAEAGLPFALGLTLVVGRILLNATVVLIRGGSNYLGRDHILATGYWLSFVGTSLFAISDIPFYDARVNVLGWLLLAVMQRLSKT
ncbi:MAG: O-antigen ligase family protein [Nodosilinea sp.]